jgi:O-antigen ligase
MATSTDSFSDSIVLGRTSGAGFRLFTRLLIGLVAAYGCYLILEGAGYEQRTIGLTLSVLVLAVGGLVIFLRPILGLAALVAALPIQAVWPDFVHVFVGGIPLVTSIMVPLGLVTLISTLVHIKDGVLPPPRWRIEHLLGIMFIVWALATDVTAATSGDRIWIWTYVQLGVLFILSGTLLQSPRSTITVALAFIGATAASVIVGWILGGFSFLQHASFEVRLSGLQGNPNEFGVICVLALVAVNFVRPHLGRLGRNFVLLSIPFLGVGVMFSISRSGLVALIVAAYLVIRWKLVWTPTLGLRKRLPARLLVVAAIAILVLVPGSYRSLLVGSLVNEISDQTGTTGLRLEAWRISRELWFENPIDGVGIGRFRAHVVERWGLVTRAPQSMNAHSSYFSLLAETGAIGLLLFVAWQVVVLRRSATASRLKPDVDMRYDMLKFWTAGIIIWAAFGLFADVHYGKWLWMAAGASSALAAGTILEYRRGTVEQRSRPPGMPGTQDLKPADARS